MVLGGVFNSSLLGISSSVMAATSGDALASQLLANLAALSPDQLDPQIVPDLRQQLEDDTTAAAAIHSIQALAASVAEREGPDRYLAAIPITPLQLAVSGSQMPAETDWGEEIFAAARSFHRSPFRRLQDRLFRWMLQNETLKKQCVAFMDAIAPQTEPHRIAELARAYFPHRTTKAPGLFGFLLKAGTLPIVPDRLLAWGVRKSVAIMADRFLTGETVEEALETVAKLAEKGIHTSLDVVREKVVSQKEADDYRNRVLRLMKLWTERYDGPARTEGGVPVRHVSVKLSALTHRFDPLAEEQVLQEAGGRLLEIFKAAKEYADQGKPILVNIDLEEFHVNSLSYRVFWETFNHPDLEGWDEAGIVIQAYFKKAEQILMQNIDCARRTGKKPQIRIVKGAYHKYEQIHAARMGWEVPVYLSQRETNRSFRQLTRLALLNQDVVHLATGSHNLNDVGFSQTAREQLGLAQAIVEAQALFGVGDPIMAATHSLGLPSRFYGPFGKQAEAIGYLVRRLSEVGPDSAIGQTHVAGNFEHYNPRGDVPLSRADSPFQLVAEPDFSKGKVRVAMQRAILEREARDSVIVQPLIGEKDPPSLNIATLEASHNPADTDDIVALVSHADERAVESAVLEAHNGYSKWSILTLQQRARALYKTAQLLQEQQYDIAALIVAEAGKPWPSALDEVYEAINFLRSYAEDGLREGNNYDPLGVGVAISPFNFSFAIAMGQMAAGLALGNAMILKPAEQTPAAGDIVARLLREGIEQSLSAETMEPEIARTIASQAVQYLPGVGAVVGQKLVENKGVDFVAFTGSKATADKIIQTAATHPPSRGGMKVVVAETGGKNAMIIDETADLDVAVEAVLFGAFQYNGQRCSATSRVIIADEIRDVFVKRLIEGARSMVSGNPSHPVTQLGPQIDQASYNKVQRYISIGQEEGATLAYAAEIPTTLAEQGFFVGPHIFTDVDPNSRLAQEEIFGPVLAIISASSFDDTLTIANQTDFGLTAGLISRYPDHIRRFFNEMKAGNKYVNRSQIGARPWETPFGGAKDSGTGPKAGGRHLVARFGKARQHHRPHPIPNDSIEWSQEDIVATETVLDEAAIHRAQHRWATTDWHERMNVLENLENRLTDWIDGAKVTPGLSGTINLQALSDRIRAFQQNAPHYLSPQETIGLPGERNEQVHDWSLGVGLIWTAQESFADFVSAAAASLLMGNAVIIPATREGLFARTLLLQAGVPEDVLVPLATSSRATLSGFDFDFVVAHGVEGFQVQQAAITQPRERRGFRRVIGVMEDPTESRYLTYFAHETTRIERTLRHGADLDLRGVLSG